MKIPERFWVVIEKVIVKFYIGRQRDLSRLKELGGRIRREEAACLVKDVHGCNSQDGVGWAKGWAKGQTLGTVGRNSASTHSPTKTQPTDGWTHCETNSVARKGHLSGPWCRNRWASTGQRMNFDLNLTPYRKIHRKWIIGCSLMKGPGDLSGLKIKS